MKSKGTKYAETSHSLNSSPIQQSPVTRNKMRNSQDSSSLTRTAAVKSQSSAERNNVNNSQENSLSPVSAPSSLSSHERNETKRNVCSVGKSSAPKNQHDQNETPIATTSFCSYSPLQQTQQQIIYTKPQAKKVYYNEQHVKFEGRNVNQISRDHEKVLISLKSENPTQAVQPETAKYDRRNSYSAAINETDQCRPLQDHIFHQPKYRYDYYKDPTEQKITDIRRGFHQKQRSDAEVSDSNTQTHFQTHLNNASETTCTNVVDTVVKTAADLELVHQKQNQTSKVKEDMNSTQNRNVQEDVPSSSQGPTPPDEMKQITPAELPSRNLNGIGSVASLLTGSSITIKSGIKGLTLVLVNSSQQHSNNGHEVQLSEENHAVDEDQEPSGVVSVQNFTANDHVIQQPAPTLNRSQTDEGCSNYEFQDVQRPIPTVPLASSTVPLLSCTTYPEQQTSSAVSLRNQGTLEQSTISSRGDISAYERSLVPIRESPGQIFRRNPGAASDLYAYAGNKVYHDAASQILPPVLASSVLRDNVYQNEIPCIHEAPPSLQYSVLEDNVPEINLQMRRPMMGQPSIHRRLSAFRQEPFPNRFRSEFIDIGPDPGYPMHRNPTGAFHSHRFDDSYGPCVYSVPRRNDGRVYIMNRRPHVYHQRIPSTRQFYDDAIDENMVFFRPY